MSVLAVLTLATCATPEAPPEQLPPQLALSTTALAYSSTTAADPPAQTVQVNNAGGGTLEWTAVSSASWLTLTPASSSLTAFVAVNGLAAGTHQATITVTAAGAASSPQTIGVTLTLTEPPTTTLSPSTLTFSAVAGAGNPPTQNVGVSFSNNAALAWTATDDASWLSVAPASGTGGAQMTATVNTTGMSAGTHTATITVSAPGTANSPRTVAVTLTLAPPPTIQLSATQLTFNATVGASPPNQTFDVNNSGGGTMAFVVSDDATWLNVSPASGTATQTVTVSVASSGLAAGTYTGTITVTANGASNTPQTVAVTLVVTAPNFNGTWIGKTSQDSTVRIEISNNAVTQIYLGWRIASCGTTGNTTTNFTQPFSVSSGSFSQTVNSSPLSYTISGTFSSSTAVAGNLTLNFSMTGPFSCSGSANLTWSATR